MDPATAVLVSTLASFIFGTFVQPALQPHQVYICAKADDGTQYCRYEKDVGQGRELRTAAR